MRPGLSRRSMLRQTSAIALGFLGLRVSAGRKLNAADIQQRRFADIYGPLQPDPAGILELPPGFRYQILSRAGERMDDGLAVPTNPDGMATFAPGDGRTVIIRNHEASGGAINAGPFALGEETFLKFDRNLLYDAGGGTQPALGGTSTIVYDTQAGRVERQFLSLAGTVRNCAGGATPWGTWATCEETNQRATGNYEKDHGYIFEVPMWAEGPVVPVPLKAMGRMNHEAIAVDPRSWIVYETEDRADSLFYRFIADRAGDLAGGGRLQALVARDQSGLDTRNLQTANLPVGEPVNVTWVDIENVESPGDDLRQQGFSKGAALFARGEGAIAAPEAIYFTATSGGRAGRGQVFRYVPSAFEGRREEWKYPGRLELFIEPNDDSVLDMPDNITVAPWGDLILCEDGTADDYLLGVTLDGEIYRIGHNAMNAVEFAGATFSPDGSTLFVNVQATGLTFAITGPWREGRRA
ncbi:MAG TPA: alkaline phosphatase PhoX [Bryobacteraceae bacterium]|nr:alkaline phosphatase PhoX [Bryobacteraceae bacterium]